MACTTTDRAYDLEGRIATMSAGSAVTTFTHDLYGRMTGRSGAASATYEWDALGHLAAVETTAARVAFAYGADGSRATRTRTASGTTETVSYLIDGTTLRGMETSDGLVYRFTYGPGGTPLGFDVVGATGGTRRYAYGLDALGSVTAVFDEHGGVVARYAYDAWGAPLAFTGPDGTAGDDALADRVAAEQPLRYRSYLWDEELRLYHMPARSYDPALGRFLSADPAGPSAGDPLSFNRSRIAWPPSSRFATARTCGTLS